MTSNLLYFLLIYLLIMNIVGFAVMGIDKRKAIKDAWRIPEKTLFLVSIIGGSLGTMLGMNFFRHKTKHWYFKFGMPLIFICHVVLLAAGFWYLFS